MKMAGSSSCKIVLDRAFFDSLLGRIVIYADGTGIVKIEHDGQPSSENIEKCINLAGDKDEAINDTYGKVSKDSTGSSNIHIDTCILWLRQYFTDPSKIKDVDQPALSMRLHQSKPFLVKVWQILRQKSKPGESMSYGKLATLAGNPKAGRSVGLAMRRNPFPIIVPCHRVIRADAKIGHYSWLNGTETKKWLLDHEKGFCH